MAAGGSVARHRGDLSARLRLCRLWLAEYTDLLTNPGLQGGEAEKAPQVKPSGARSRFQSGHRSKRSDQEVLNLRPVARVQTEGAVNELPWDVAGREIGSPSQTKGILRAEQRWQVADSKRGAQIGGEPGNRAQTGILRYNKSLLCLEM